MSSELRQGRPIRRPEIEPENSPGAALVPFLRGILAHRLVFLAIVVACLLGAGVWLAHRTVTYEANAQVLVSPIPASDDAFVGLPVIRASELEPQRAAATAAGLLESPAAARRTAKGLGVSAGGVESAVEVAAVPSSSLVKINAEAHSATEATLLANAYAAAALKVRALYLEPRVKQAIAHTEEQLALLPDQFGAEANALKSRLAELRTIVGRGDPTLSLARPASNGISPNSSSKEVVLLALLAGLLLAGLTVVLIQVLTVPPIDSESDLKKLYPLPVLARVPAGGERSSAKLRGPLERDDPAVREGFRALRGQLELRATDRKEGRRGQGTTVLMVSPEPDPSRPACSLDLARAFASIHGSASILELDLENPQIAGLVDLDPRTDLSAVLDGAALESSAEVIGGAGVRLVAAPPGIDPATHEALWARSAAIVEDARGLDEWVVVDAAPITRSVADTTAALQAIDHIVVVVHLGSSRPQALGVLRELFDLLRRRPDGYLVVGGTNA